MYSIYNGDWLLTPQGKASPHEILSSPQNFEDLTSGFVHQDAALLRLLILMQGRASTRTLDLFGTRPFLQLPLWELPEEAVQKVSTFPIHRLSLTQATGSDVTLLSRTFDETPEPVSYAQAARILTAYQLFAPSRGITKWNPSKDNPLARSVTFHAIGEHLGETLSLNTPPELASQPAFWEEYLNWGDWYAGAKHPLTLSHLHAYPWSSVTLLAEGGAISQVKLVSGVVANNPEDAPWPDPHTLRETYTKTSKTGPDEVTLSRLRNPQTREVRGALVQAMIAGLSGDPQAPVSFLHAAKRGASKARATGLITATGQPVVQTLAEAELPWPKNSSAREGLELAYEGLQAATGQGRNYLQKAGVPSTVTSILSGQLPGDYWQRVWPTLTLYLSGACDFDDLSSVVSALPWQVTQALLHQSESFIRRAE